MTLKLEQLTIWKKVALPPLLDFYWHDLKAFEEAINKTNIICLLVPSFKYLRDHFCNPIVMITSINVRFPPVPNLHVMDGFGRLLRWYKSKGKGSHWITNHISDPKFNYHIPGFNLHTCIPPTPFNMQCTAHLECHLNATLPPPSPVQAGAHQGSSIFSFT